MGATSVKTAENVKHGVLRVHVLHEVKLIAVPAFEPLFELIEHFGGNCLGDGPSLPPLVAFAAEERSGSNHR
jgi:hypothetical protein